MRLYLSSFRMGDRFEELVAAMRPGAKVAVISNAVDFIPNETRATYAAKVFDPVVVFTEHGFEARNLDLRLHFRAPETLRAAMAEVDLVWAVGGNAFLLRRAMRQSGFDELVRGRVAEGSLIFAGWSAGAVVAGPGLRGIELMDDPTVVVDGYDPAPIWEGLGLIDYTIVPHFRSEHPEAQAADQAIAAMIDAGMPLRALRDGQVVIV